MPHERGTVTPDDDTPGRRFVRGFRRVWRDDRPEVAIPRDIILVVGVLGMVLVSLWAYTGQPFPDTSPLVVVESGSMMHPGAPYGHVGTIDPGDLILVKDVDGADDIQTAYQRADRSGYGGYGDVVIYRPNNRPDATPIIHRAMTWVEVTQAAGSDELRYTYHDESGQLLENERAVTLESIGIRDMRPTTSGFITKGDNPDTNQVADQVTHVPGRLVEPEWIVGKARGEIPWLGLVKLAMTGNPVPVDTAGNCRVLNAWAPCDTWIMLGLGFVALIGTPFALDRVAKNNESFGRWLRK